MKVVVAVAKKLLVCIWHILNFNVSNKDFEPQKSVAKLIISILRQVRETFGKHFKHILRILHAYIMSKKVPYDP